MPIACIRLLAYLMSKFLVKDYACFYYAAWFMRAKNDQIRSMNMAK